MRRRLILGTAGHIDHGKTALVRALTGVDTDRLPEEKRRGITVDIGFARLDLPGCTLGVVDVPGHERFIRNMLAGASGVDIALLVIAADEGVMPQTREHLAILDLLNVRCAVVALTKVDLVDDDWAALVEEEARDAIAGSTLAEAPIVRTSARAGLGLDDLTRRLADACDGARRAGLDHPFRMWIDRSFAKEGLGTIVTGTVASGSASVDDALELLPAGVEVRVRALHSHGEPCAQVSAGQRAAMQLAGAHHREVRRGDALAAPGHLRPTRSVIARVRALPESPRPVAHRARVRLHIGSQETMASVRLLDATTIEPGASALAQLVTAEPVVAHATQAFVLRSESPVLTIGGGRVIFPGRIQINRRDGAAVERLRRLESDDPTARAGEALRLRGAAPWTPMDLCRDAGVSIGEAERAVTTLRSGGALPLVRIGAQEQRMHADVIEQAHGRIEAALSRLHEASPTAAGFPPRHVAQRIRSMSADVVEGVIRLQQERGALGGDGALVWLPDRAGALSARERAMLAALLEAHEAGAFTPPSIDAVADLIGATPAEAQALVERATQTGDLVHVGAGVRLHRAWAVELRRRVVDLMRRRPDGVTVGDIRDALGASRKFAIPICEHLDRTRITKRRGDRRVPGSAAEQVPSGEESGHG